jgi:Spy/CpxP family protein refolding chaperone
MTKDSKVRTVLGVAVAAALVGTVAIGVTYADQQAPNRGGMMMRGHRMMAGGPLGAMRRGLAQLGLSADQKQQIKGIVQSHKDELEGPVANMRQARRAVGDAIAGDKFDEVAIRAASANLAKAQADLAVTGAKIRGEIFDRVLTPDQQAKAKALRLQALQRADRFMARRQRASGF